MSASRESPGSLDEIQGTLSLQSSRDDPEVRRIFDKFSIENASMLRLQVPSL
jgi:hypothetical protein